MFSNGQILALVDYKKAEQPALEKALSLAEKSNSKVLALLVVYDRAAEVDTMVAGTILKNLRKPLLAEATQWLEDLLSIYTERGIAIDHKVEWNKRTYRTVLECLKLDTYDLVVKSSTHHSALKRIIRTPDDWHLIREANVPLFFVKDSTPLNNQKVLISMDTSDHENLHETLNQKLLKFGKDLHAHYGCEVNVVNAYPTLNGLASVIPEGASYELYEEGLKEAHKEALSLFGKKNGVEEDQLHLCRGGVGEAVQSVVQDIDSHLVICGTHARGGVDGVVIGNSAESILEHTDCNLLVLKL